MATVYFEADWNKDGLITTEQGTRLQGVLIRRGRNGSVNSNGYAEVDAGEMTVTLKNDDGRYSLFNSSGNLYSYLRPNIDVRVQWYDSSLSGGQGSLFRGLVSNIVNFPDKKQANIEALDGIEFLKKRKGDDLGLQENYAVSSAMVDVLTVAGYPYTDGTEWIFPATFPATLGGSAIENNGDTVRYFWGQPSKSAWEQLIDLAYAFAGDVFIAADGTFSYAARGVHRASLLTLTDADVRAGSQPEQPWGEIRNYIKIAVKTLTSSGAGVEIYQMYDTVYLGAGESITVWCDFSYGGKSGPAAAVTTPVSTTDYTANTAADGSGSDRTANLDVTFTAYTERAKVVFENTGSDGLYITMFKIRGELLTVVNESAQIAEDTASQDDYEKREMRVESPFIQEQTIAAYHASYAKMLYADPRKVMWVRILNRHDIQLRPDLFDVVTLNLSSLGATGDYLITYIEHDFRPNNWLTTWRLEPKPPSGMVFPATFPSVLGW